MSALTEALQSVPVDVPKQMVAQRRGDKQAFSVAKEAWEIEEADVVLHAQLGAGAFSAVFR